MGKHKGMNAYIRKNIKHLSSGVVYNILSDISDISWDIVINNSHMSWNWTKLSKRVPKDVYLKNDDRKWNFAILAKRGFITFDELIQEVVSKSNNMRSNIYNLSKYCPIEIIEKHPEVKWSYRGLGLNKHITSEFVMKHCNRDILDLDSHWQYHTLDLVFPLEFILEHCYTRWECKTVKGGVTLDMIKKYPRIWDMRHLSKTFHVDYIMGNLDINWSFYHVSENPTLTREHVLMNVFKDWRRDILIKKFGKEFVTENFYDYHFSHEFNCIETTDIKECFICKKKLTKFEEILILGCGCIVCSMHRLTHCPNPRCNAKIEVVYEIF